MEIINRTLFVTAFLLMALSCTAHPIAAYSSTETCTTKYSSEYHQELEKLRNDPSTSPTDKIDAEQTLALHYEDLWLQCKEESSAAKPLGKL